MRQKLHRFWNCCFELCRSQERIKRRHIVIPILLAFGEITQFSTQTSENLSDAAPPENKFVNQNFDACISKTYQL